uniref:Uncharacterized protein n=1 Tax=Anguilla anguilla TaxID=7936 RepID=A0A0E9SEM9_ANGAN
MRVRRVMFPSETNLWKSLFGILT